MNSSSVIQLGNPILRIPSTPVDENEFDTESLRELIAKLFLIMHKEGGIGIAAPQIGINKRIFVFGLEGHAISPTVLINPIMHPLSEVQEEGYEGCLSVGSLRGKVPRYSKIYYKGYDEHGNLIESEVQDYHARVIQHENDHLDGVVFIDRIKDYSSLGFHDELINAGKLPVKNR